MAVRSITNETFDEVYNFLRHKVDRDAAEGFKNSPNKLGWLEKYWGRLELDEDWTDKYKSMEDIVGNKFKTFPSLFEELNGTKPTDARFATIKKKYPWIVREDLNEWIDKQNQYNKFYKDEATNELNKNLRTKEVKDWSLWRKLLASDYEKQRYIDDPQSAIFGDQAAGFVKSSPGSKADLISGVAAGGADLLPTKFALPVGPAIRFGRDVVHKANSPYQKDWDEIFTDAGKDLVLNGATYGLANSKKLARVASEYADPKVRTAYQLNNERESIKKGIDILDNSNADDITSLMAEINNLPPSKLKDDLMREAGDWTTKGINPDRMNKVVEDYRKSLKPETEELYKMMINNPNYKSPKPNSFLQEKLLYNENPMRGIANKAEYSVLRGANALNTGKPGYMIYSGTRTAYGRGVSPQTIETEERKQEFEDSVERIKNNYGLLWSRNRKPEGYDNPIIREAYNRWLQEQ